MWRKERQRGRERASRGALAAALAGLLLCVIVSGCGYQLVGRGNTRGAAKSVVLRGFTNETKEPGVENIVSDALYREFARRGDLRLVSDTSTADMEVSGAVVSAFVSARSFSSVQFTVEYEVYMSLSVSVRPRDGAAIPLDPRSLTESERFLASADIEVVRKNREEALRRLAGLLATRVHDALYAVAPPTTASP